MLRKGTWYHNPSSKHLGPGHRLARLLFEAGPSSFDPLTTGANIAYRCRRESNWFSQFVLEIAMSADRTASWMSSPWLTIWFKPQETIKRVTQTNDIGSVLCLGAAAGICNVLSVSDTLQLRGEALLIVAFLLGSLQGLIYLPVASGLYTWVGRLLRGKASYRQMVSAYAWSMAPMLLWLALLLGLFLFYGSAKLGLLLSSDSGEASGGELFVLALMGLAAIWSIVLLVRTFGAVQDFGVFRSIVTVVVPVIFLLLIAFSIRSFIAQPFNIPAQSMTPALLVGDHLFLDKTCYGYSKYTSPLMPDFDGRVWRSAPKRGDIVVFKLPKDNRTDYVKRIVGLPGDEIEMKDGVLHINRTAVPRKRVEDFIDDTSRQRDGIEAFEETLPNGVRYTVLDLRNNGEFDDAGPFKVPAGHYFMLGDNRDNSVDSRMQEHIGFVPEENLLGCAPVLYFSAAPLPKKHSDDCWFCNIRFERFWKRVQ